MDVNWIRLTEDQIQRRVFVNMAMGVCILSKEGIGWSADRLSASYEDLCSKILERRRAFMKQISH
jgi:hypothetical protein